ncbi:transient receptor potential cation channel subfamily A member 1, partial [Paragonimus westermani]
EFHSHFRPQCIAFGRLDELFDLLLNSTELVNLQDATGSSLLHSAVDKGSTELVNLLLSRGAVLYIPTSSPTDVNLANHAGNRPIHLAFKGCRKSVIELLLSHGADYTCKNTDGVQPIHLAAEMNFVDGLKICLLQRADLLAKDLTGQIPLHFACARGDLDCVQLLTEFRPRLKPRMIREPNNDGRTPMHVAAMHNSTEVIDYLVSQGAELNPVDQKRLTPLLLACSKGAIKSCTHLMGLGADLTACDEFGRNMLIMLLLSGAGKARELVPALTKSGKFPLLLNQPDKWGCTYMHVAARLGLRVAIKHGLTNQGSLLIRDSERSTPLHSAARFGRLNICAQMLEVDEGKRAQFLVDQLGRFPVHLAAQYGHNRVLELFQSKGCIQRRCRQGNTTLHYAAMSGNPATCALILGINPSLLNETNHNGVSLATLLFLC